MLTLLSLCTNRPTTRCASEEHTGTDTHICGFKRQRIIIGAGKLGNSLSSDLKRICTLLEVQLCASASMQHLP